MCANFQYGRKHTKCGTLETSMYECGDERPRVATSGDTIYIYIYIYLYLYIYIWFYFCFYVHRTCSPQPGRCSTLIYNRHDHHHDHPDHHWIIIIIITTITPSHHYHHHIKICHPLWTRCWIRDQKSPPSMNNMLGRRGRLAPFLLTWPCLKKQLRRNNKLAGLWKLRTWMVCQHYTFTRT